MGDPVPADGSLPPEVLRALPERAHKPFGLYVHIPFCSVRCGYCDFNTYTAEDLGPGASRLSYPDTLIAELEFAAELLERSDAPPRPLASVFFGGGTPTLLPSDQLDRILARARDLFGLAEHAEVTTEANPDTVDLASARTLADAGFTRVSLGMQSAVPHVLKTLDRTHDPSNVGHAVDAVRQAGMQVSLDLISGTPGESLADWRASLVEAVRLKPDHLSVYSLIVEDGTAMAAKIRRGELADVDSDDHAEKYLLTDELLEREGYRWYEVSNFSRGPQTRSVHNMNYWTDSDWWGAGPGAHSHLAGLRWWNVKHPAAYAARLADGVTPGHGRELLDDEALRLEHLMLRLRIAEGLDIDDYEQLPGAEKIPEAELNRLSEEGLAVEAAIQPDDRHARGRVVLTLKGRLLADAVTRRLSG